MSYQSTVLGGIAFVVAASLPFIAIAKEEGGKPVAMKPAAAPASSAPTGHSSAGSSSHSKIDFEQMDTMMKERTAKFPVKTKGVGAQPLAPKLLADGTKEFHLTTEITDWEVEPGKVVKAWTYNGQVPGPTISVDVGDKVRVVVTNKLPESTAVHFHGVRTPNSQDGVPDITQEPIKPGERFTYSFTADRIAVGMYHSHHNAVIQVPNGLAGTFLIGRMPVPKGVQVAQELPMMLDDSGVIGFALNGK